MYCQSAYTSEFAKVCERSTDFHFPNLEEQFTKIEEQLKLAADTRKKATEDGDKVSLKSSGSNSSADTGNQVN